MRLDLPKRVVLSPYKWNKLRGQVYDEQNHHCAECGKLIAFHYFHLHHKKLRGMGGGKRDDSRENVEGLCGGFPDSCHSKEHNQ
jgi:5-methylcytosine-specific restriction endonuclease McrA